MQPDLADALAFSARWQRANEEWARVCVLYREPPLPLPTSHPAVLVRFLAMGAHVNTVNDYGHMLLLLHLIRQDRKTAAVIGR